MGRCRNLWLLLAAFPFYLVHSPDLDAGTFSQISTDRRVIVSHVYDGDTFRTRSGEKVRLLGINTPEIARDATPGEPMAEEARIRLAERIEGKTVRLVFDRERQDSYGRLLAHVYLPDGTWINADLIGQGLAHTYTFAPNTMFCHELQALERDPRLKSAGIWSSERFGQLDARQVSKRHIGQFRVITGKVTATGNHGWTFSMGKLAISIPRKYRQGFRNPPAVNPGDTVTVHGTVRISSKKRLYLALHTPCDLEIMQP